MSEVELVLFEEAEGCTLYTLQFAGSDDSEYEKFYLRFKNSAEYDRDLARIVQFIGKISAIGALERFFRPEGRLTDRVCALPVVKSSLRLYCLRLSDKILILGNGGAKTTRTYQESDELKGHVLTLQKFDKLLKEGEHEGTIKIYERAIETDKNLEL